MGADHRSPAPLGLGYLDRVRTAIRLLTVTLALGCTSQEPPAPASRRDVAAPLLRFTPR
jgi:hypothetical protein